jgi:hypothetical protein
MVQQIRPEVGAAVYGRTDLVYLVCPPHPGGRHPCLDLAELRGED